MWCVCFNSNRERKGGLCRPELDEGVRGAEQRPVESTQPSCLRGTGPSTFLLPLSCPQWTHQKNTNAFPGLGGLVQGSLACFFHRRSKSAALSHGWRWGQLWLLAHKWRHHGLDKRKKTSTRGTLFCQVPYSVRRKSCCIVLRPKRLEKNVWESWEMAINRRESRWQWPPLAVVTHSRWSWNEAHLCTELASIFLNPLTKLQKLSFF